MEAKPVAIVLKLLFCLLVIYLSVIRQHLYIPYLRVSFSKQQSGRCISENIYSFDFVKQFSKVKPSQACSRSRKAPIFFIYNVGEFDML